MEEKNKKEEKEKVEKEKTPNFRAVQNPNSYKSSYQSDNTKKHSIGFGRGVFVPFISGILGCLVVIGTCFGVPSIRSKLIDVQDNNSNNTGNSGYVDQSSLSNYSDTSIYVANKILPSIVGIKVEYNVNSYMSIFGKQSKVSAATASGSGIIISEDGYILTNNHIVSTSSSESYYEVSDATKVTVNLFNDET